MSIIQAYRSAYGTTKAESFGSNIQEKLINGQLSLLQKSRCWHVLSFGAVALSETINIVKNVSAVAEVALRGLMNLIAGVFTLNFQKIDAGFMKLFVFSPSGALAFCVKDLPLSILNVTRSILFPAKAIEDSLKRALADKMWYKA